jgi:hypothetical protein
MGLKNLYQIEMEKGKGINVTISEYLLSLPYEKQMRILARHLKNLKEALLKKITADDSKLEGLSGGYDELDKDDLQINIIVTEELVSKIRKEAEES